MNHGQAVRLRIIHSSANTPYMSYLIQNIHNIIH